VGVAAVSAAILIFEIALSRIFAVSQFYHFAFLAVSLALLGFGASGSALAAFPSLGRGGPRRWSRLAVAQAVTTLGAYVVINSLPFDSFAVAWDRRQLLYLAVYYVSLAVPFFFGGAVIGILLSARASRPSVASHHIYAASLVGSGAGCLVALRGVDVLGGERTVALAALVAALGAVVFAGGDPVENRRRPPGSVLAALALAPLVVFTPSFFELKLSPYKDLSAALRYPGAEVVSSEWDQGTRVDHLRSDGIRSFAGLSLSYAGTLDPQDGLTFDGDNLSPIPRVPPQDARFAPYLLGALAFEMRPGADALVLEPRGGLDVVVALAMGAARVTVVESLAAAVDAVTDSPDSIYSDPRVTVIEAEPRSHLAAAADLFDVIDVALTSPYRPVTSGAYSLAEDFSITVEAFEQYLSRLNPDGLLTLARWVQVPPSEEVRLLATAAEAARRSGADPSSSIVALRGYATALVLVQPDGFDAGDMAVVREFAERGRFDIIAGPGVAGPETNRFNLLPEDEYHPLAVALLTTEVPATVYSDYEFDIVPPTDDHPFFGHFFKWAQAPRVLDELGRTWQPFGGAGYFVLLALLALSVVGASVLIVLPLVVTRVTGKADGGPPGMRWWTLGYFGLLGMAFLFVEIPLIQQYILLTGNATRSLTLVLFVILVASGIGSLLSRHIPWRIGALGLAVAVALYSLVMRAGIAWMLGAPLPIRTVAGGLAVAPIGFLMGIMFPRGLEKLEREAPDLVPWAWGINGTVSVISAAASALLALNYGFSFVMLLGAAAYGLSAALAGSKTSPIPRPEAAIPRPG
jgi:hypothetical protein